MQFTVLIEFLIPGLATVLIGLALLPTGSLPPLPELLSGNDTATTLLLVAIAYPVGIIVNFPLFWLQQRLFTVPARRAIVLKYSKEVKLQPFFGSVEGLQTLGVEALRDLFAPVRIEVFRENFERFRSRHKFYESLQRLARGMVLPLFLTGVWAVLKQGLMAVAVVFVLLLLEYFSVWLLQHAVREEEENVVRWYLAMSPNREMGGVSDAK